MSCLGDCTINIEGSYNGPSAITFWELNSSTAPGPPYNIKYGGITKSTPVGVPWALLDRDMTDVCFEDAPAGTYVFRAIAEQGVCAPDTADFTVVVYAQCGTTVSAFMSCGTAREFEVNQATSNLDQIEFGDLRNQNPTCSEVLPASGDIIDAFFVVGGSDPAYWNDDPSEGFVGSRAPGYSLGGNLTVPNFVPTPGVCYGFRYREAPDGSSNTCEDCFGETVHYFKVKEVCDYCADMVDFNTKSNTVDIQAAVNSPNPIAEVQAIVTSSCGPKYFEGTLETIYMAGLEFFQGIDLAIGESTSSFIMENSSSGLINVDLSSVPAYTGSNGSTISTSINALITSGLVGDRAYRSTLVDTGTNLIIKYFCLAVHSATNYTGWDSSSSHGFSDVGGGSRISGGDNTVISSSPYTISGISFNYTINNKLFKSGVANIGPLTTPCGNVDTVNNNIFGGTGVISVGGSSFDNLVLTKTDHLFQPSTFGFGGNPQCRNC